MKAMTGSRGNLEVFDFKEEDELTGYTVKYTRSFKNAIDKYALIQNAAQGSNIQSKEMGNLQYVENVDLMDNEDGFSVSCTPPSTKGDCTTKVVLFNSTGHEKQPEFIPNNIKPGSISQLETRTLSPQAALAGDIQLSCASQERSSSDDSVNEISDADERLTATSASTSSDTLEDAVLIDGSLSIHCIVDWQMGDKNMAVVNPDFIIYHGAHCADSLLIFSCTGIEMRVSPVYGTEETHRWEIDDIVNIESQWSKRLEIVTVTLRMLSKEMVREHNECRISGLEDLMFALSGKSWCEKLQEIMSLDVKYKALWSVIDCDVKGDVEALIDENDICIPKTRYFPDFHWSFEEVVYPKGEPDAVSICKRDVDLLQPDTFVNDTIIDFYIKHLKNKIQPDKRHRFHFFNSFFFRKLIDLDKDPSSAFKGGVAFQRVHKWTRKVNLFEKDYVFIPVNFSYHWSLIVICYPGEVGNFQDKDVENSLKVPCILHMDSIKGSHSGLKDVIQSYLWEEWKERQKEESEEIYTKFFNLRFVPLELPQQQNSFDCGLFLLHYVERFLDEAPDNFNPFKITRFSNFLNVDWFPPAEASLKRGLIQRFIYEILEEENSQSGCISRCCAFGSSESNNECATGVQFASGKGCQRNLSNTQNDEGIEITLLPGSSLRNAQGVGDSGFVLRELFEAGAPAASFLDGQYQTFDQAAPFNEFRSMMPPVEQEEVEADEQLVFSTSKGTIVQPLAATGAEVSVLPCSTGGLGAETYRNPEISDPRVENKGISQSSGASACATDDSLKIETRKNSLVMDDLSSKEKIDHPRYLSIENIECFNYASPPHEMLDAGPCHSDCMIDGNGDADCLTPCSNHPLGSFYQGVITKENGDNAADNLRIIEDGSVSKLDAPQAAKRSGGDSDDASVLELKEQKPMKRLRLSPLFEKDERVMSSASEDPEL